MAKELAGPNPFPHHKHRVMKGGAHNNHLKAGKIKHAKSSKFVNSLVSTDHVKGPLKVSGKHKTSRKKTTVKA